MSCIISQPAPDICTTGLPSYKDETSSRPLVSPAAVCPASQGYHEGDYRLNRRQTGRRGSTGRERVNGEAIIVDLGTDLTRPLSKLPLDQQRDRSCIASFRGARAGYDASLFPSACMASSRDIIGKLGPTDRRESGRYGVRAAGLAKWRVLVSWVCDAIGGMRYPDPGFSWSWRGCLGQWNLMRSLAPDGQGCASFPPGRWSTHVVVIVRKIGSELIPALDSQARARMLVLGPRNWFCGASALMVSYSSMKLGCKVSIGFSGSAEGALAQPHVW
jgi:hypothetical protein